VLVFVVLMSGASARQDPNYKHKTHNVTFYAHEAIETGVDATARIVAGPGGNLSALQFGAVVVVDDPITATADPKSAPLGKMQGLYVLDGGQKFRVQVSVIIDQPGDLVETTYEVRTLLSSDHHAWHGISVYSKLLHMNFKDTWLQC